MVQVRAEDGTVIEIVVGEPLLASDQHASHDAIVASQRAWKPWTDQPTLGQTAFVQEQIRLATAGGDKEARRRRPLR
jgi:hypothetical protein